MNTCLRFALLAVLCFQPSLFAAIKTWDGSSSGNWSTGANWTDGTPPVNGDQLRFPGGTVSRRIITNNIANLRSTIVFFQGADSSNYVVRGNALTLTGDGATGPSWGSQSSGSNRLELDITFDPSFGSSAISATGTGGSMAITGDVLIDGSTSFVGDLHLSGAISGTGDVDYRGGVAVLTGTNANTYVGSTTVDGTLRLSRSRFTGLAFIGVTCVPGDLRIGLGAGSDIVELLFGNQIADTANVTMVMSAPPPGNIALLDLNGFDETIGSLTISGGNVLGSGGMLTLNGNIDVRTSSRISTIAADVNLGNGIRIINVTTNTVDPDLEIVGAISGSGGISKAGLGTLALGGLTDNTYGGATTVLEGVLQLSKTNAFAIQGSDLIIGENSSSSPLDVVRYTSSNQLPNSTDITVNSSGVLDLNDFTDAFGSVNLVGGTVQSDTGTIQLRGPLTATGIRHGFIFDSSLILGNLDLGTANRTVTVNDDAFGSLSIELGISADVTGTAGIIKTGAGQALLNGANSFNGVVTINQGTLIAASVTALGNTNIGTTVNNDATLKLDDALILREPLTLNSSASEPGALVGTGTTNLWTGPITLSQTARVGVDPSAALNLQCPISGAGGLEKEGDGLLKLSGNVANTYTGLTVVKAGTMFPDQTAAPGAIPGDVVIGDGIGGADADLLFYSLNQINTQSRVTVASSGKLLVGADTIGSLSGTGRVEVLNTGELRTGGNNDSTTYTGLIIGGGGIVKRGTGTFTLTRNNTYTGLTTVEAGTLTVNGNQDDSDVAVRLDATLAGRGSVGDLTVDAGGIVSPGVGPARLFTRGTVLSDEGRLQIELNGPIAGSQYDILDVNGPLTLTSSELQVTLNHAPLDGHVFTIIDNDGSDATVGAFDGLANGAILTLNQIPLRINYNGGTGNDVTLTVTNLPLHAAGSSIATGDLNNRIDVNECNQLFLRITNSSGAPLSGVVATLSTLTPNVFITENQSAYPNIPAGAVRTNTVPFQFFTTPGFLCGTDISFVLTIVTPANGVFSLSYILPTGALQPAVAFNNSNPFTIPDANATVSPITVSSVAGGIAKLTVSLHLTHPNVNSLQVFLTSPDGLTLPVVIGAVGNALGSGCNAGGRMVLDDDATRTIASGPAPYVGLFKPVAPLSLYDGKSGSGINGTWLLRVQDISPDASVGVLSCWGLTITPATCTDGGGACEPCNGPFFGSITTNDLRSSFVFLPSGASSVCGPGSAPCNTAARQGFYDAFTFTNAGPDSCVTVTLSTPCGTNQNALYSAAFSGEFNPTNLPPGNRCVTRIGFIDNPPDTEGTYSFQVASNAVFTVIVSSLNTLTTGGCSNYLLSVDGFECPVALSFGRTSTGGFIINWPTHGNGFLPECTTNLANPNWTVLTNEARADDGRFIITNAVNVPKAFYRLRRP